MDIQRLRSLTTGILHTEINHIYNDLGDILGQDGLMTHMLPRAVRAVEPWLREHVTEPRFWDGKYDPTHTGEYDLPEPTFEDRAAMLARYFDQPDPLDGKDVIVLGAVEQEQPKPVETKTLYSADGVLFCFKTLNELIQSDLGDTPIGTAYWQAEFSLVQVRDVFSPCNIVEDIIDNIRCEMSGRCADEDAGDALDFSEEGCAHLATLLAVWVEKAIKISRPLYKLSSAPQEMRVTREDHDAACADCAESLKNSKSTD